MLKYLIYCLLAFSAAAEVHFEAGKPYVKVSTGIFPLDLKELTVESEKRMFWQDVGNEVNVYKKQLGHLAYDLKYQMSEVKHQGPRGTCSAFQVMGLIEHHENRFNDFSEQCLVHRSSDEDPGDPFLRLHHARNSGFYLERDCPYVDPSKDPKWQNANEEIREQLKQAARRSIPDLAGKNSLSFSGAIIDRNVADFGISENLDYVRKKVMANLPVGVTIFVLGNEWEHGLILKVPSADEIKKSCPVVRSFGQGKKYCSNHAIIITGFDDARGVLYFKNSWNKPWGVNRKYLLPAPHETGMGYGVLSYEYFSRFINGKLITLE